ncbi:His-Xaa-Ser system protein HxsD [Patescibacteria group bacterium]|nr:His-Xaa-Ser system protein HxsD [Patescibacteria group bacterium]
MQITVSLKIYPLEAIYGAAYVFLNRAYIFLDEKKKGEILITLKPKEKMADKQLKALSGEFHNELLNYSLRNQISQNNRKLREYIVSRALIGALKENDGEDIEEEIEEWQGDDLGISVPWEKKFKKK